RRNQQHAHDDAAADAVHSIFGEDLSAVDEAPAARIALIVSPSFDSISGFWSAGRSTYASGRPPDP
ncbi:hypothetical protein, partial [Bradyrhizobium sp.]|uniref:hypothetical protein n=1 Tax=Bradyrhizobium sp. TaxID=376 RepID=UPI003BB07F5F